MSPFTEAQEARLREIVREELHAADRRLGDLERQVANLALNQAGARERITFTPIGAGRPTKFKGVRSPNPSSSQQERP